MTFHPERKAARCSGVDQAQAKPLSASHCDVGTQRAVDENRGARICAIGRRAEHEQDIAIDVDRLLFLDDQRAIEALRDLSACQGVVPERAGVGRFEAIIKARAGCGCRLGQLRHTVHGVGQSHAVPMHAGRLDELVDETYAQLFTALPS
jgi:hypothetical protein